MRTEATYPHVTHGKAASIRACALREETHESLACHAANLETALHGIMAALDPNSVHPLDTDHAWDLARSALTDAL